ncbi:TonB-linked outer membrane protein, SusC/RagA family [Mariniphaga anaerophila]|uniref:TonB-linked outer membrane protein, SusC/RagA family n=1 Tax=Mariniphaga anaerophila TaxID=1484053 RepID=A0A1M4VQ11_9BACT|nr:SusC/RagA family TonB-linked outer membrane protein [Mariniphaga anaerophila]SHE71018.1 TonB-linked outer membrane protein, SusC/RagA family [Mariniphaga anaerophila]
MKKIAFYFSILLFMGLSAVNAQTRIITGKVTSGEDDMPIPGVSILVQGTTLGSVTDIDGNYSLQVPESAQVLVFSFVGMSTQDVAINGRAVINVVLQPQSIGVDEVVVTALGIRKDKKALGYSVQAIAEEDLVRTGNSNLLGAMQGKIAGVDIKPSSGMPGASSQLVIRGARSFTGNNTPLYVVDGMPIASTSPYSTGSSVTGADVANRALDINPADIESIDILKGQSAAALYGIRASNGVILITTKSGRGMAVGKPVVTINHNSSFDVVSRTPDYQTTWAQGSYGVYSPTASFSWGPKISELPNDPARGGNTDNQYTAEWGKQEGKFYVPQLAQAGLNPWKTPQVYNSWDDYFQTGYTNSNNINVSQATKEGNFALGLSVTDQSGIALSTGMTRYNAKAAGERNLNKNFKVGYSANYSKSNIDKLSGANDGSLTGVLAAPRSYDLKGTPYHYPGNPYRQIYFRGGSFDNSYWIPDNNTFNEKNERFFGNGYVNFITTLSDGMNLSLRYQAGTDTYTTHLQDIFGYGSRGNSKGVIDNYGTTYALFNSTATANFDWIINDEMEFNAMLGNELNHSTSKTYSQTGTDFNFGGWNHIGNANIVTGNESQNSYRDVGVFGSLSFSWRSMLFLNATGRNDIVSQMPRGNRSFFYPSVSLGFVLTELESVKNAEWLSFAKIRASYAEVGQAGRYYQNYYATPSYGGGFWLSDPVQYPIEGINSYVPNTTQYDPNLKPQNTQSYELGADLKFFNNRFGIDYTYSQQEVTDQIFAVPLAGSTGASSLVMNGGAVKTESHEIMMYITPVRTRDFQWDMSFNFASVKNNVIELAEGVESIFLGGFVTPQVRAGIGNTYPVIYGVSFAKDDAGNIIVEDNPGAWNHGMPKTGEPGVIGEVSPDFILGATNTFSYKNVSLSAVFEWKNGGEMYSGSNGLIDLYGVSKVTEDRQSTFIFKGVKPDGTPNDIVRGGATDPDALQDLYTNVLSNIDEYYIHENSFVKLRELSLRYKFAKPIYKTLNVGVSLYSRNILLWTALRNLDPETSQGNNNMGGSFERFSLPQTTSYGFGFDITF